MKAEYNLYRLVRNLTYDGEMPVDKEEFRLALYEAVILYRKTLLEKLKNHMYPIEDHDRFKVLLEKFGL